MTSSRPTLAATSRSELGKANAIVRRAGRVPAVIFGHGESASVSVDAHDFELLRRRAGANAIFDLVVDGSGATPVLVHGVQRDKVTRIPIHVDLFRVRLTEELIVDVAVNTTGTAEAVERHGGTLFHALDHVRVKARPDNLPSALEVDISVLEDFDAAIRAGDIPLPANVTMITDAEEIVIRVLAPRVSEEPVVAEEAVEAAPAPEPAAE